MKLAFFIIAALLAVAWILGYFVFNAGAFIHFFVISSALKYSWTEMQPGRFVMQWFGFLLRIGYILTFLVAEGICILGLAKLIDILHIRLTELKR